MKYNKLGHSDIEISEICLGSMTWGAQNTQEEAFEQIDYALDQGVNFIDTAELYAIPKSADSQGKTEEIIGHWFEKSGRRDDVVLASKVVGIGVDWIRSGKGIDKENIEQALERSLERLKTDYIDLYQLHWPNRGSYHFGQFFDYDASQQDTNAIHDNMLEVLETLNHFQKSGKIRAVGLSNETAWGTMKFLELARSHGYPQMVSMQNEYSLLYRRFDTHLAEVARHENVGLLSYSSLSSGLLTGKYQGGVIPKGSRAEVIPRLWGRLNEKTLAAVAAYEEVADKHGLDLAQMSLAFVLSRFFTKSVIIGATKMDQLKKNIAATDIQLSDEVLADIKDVYKRFPVLY